MEPRVSAGQAPCPAPIQLSAGACVCQQRSAHPPLPGHLPGRVGMATRAAEPGSQLGKEQRKAMPFRAKAAKMLELILRSHGPHAIGVWGPEYVGCSRDAGGHKSPLLTRYKAPPSPSLAHPPAPQPASCLLHSPLTLSLIRQRLFRTPRMQPRSPSSSASRRCCADTRLPTLLQHRPESSLHHHPTKLHGARFSLELSPGSSTRRLAFATRQNTELKHPVSTSSSESSSEESRPRAGNIRPEARGSPEL